MGDVDLVPFDSADTLACTAAREWLDKFVGSPAPSRTKPHPHCAAFSGGRIAKKFFEAIASAGRSRLDSVHFFWADERCVPPGHADSNYRLMHERLLEPLKISDAHVHRIKGELGAGGAAREASDDLRRTVTGPLDFVFLGMGEDGHVASVFPGDLLEESVNDFYRPIFNSPKPPPERVTLSMQSMVAARNVWVFVSGAGKDLALGKSLKQDSATPLGTLLKRRLETRVFTDFRPK